MKKVLITIITMFLPILAHAYDYNGLSYNINSDKTATVINSLTYTYTGDMVIPSEIIYLGESHKVIAIGEVAFKNCTGLKSIKFPDTIESISYSAFQGCSGLKSISFPESLKTISDNAFSGCSGISTLIITKGITSLGYTAFENCTSLTKVEVYGSVNTASYSIGNQFYGCTNLKDVVFDCETVYPIFRGNEYLEHITLKEAVKNINDYSFDNCTGLKSVIVKSDLLSVGYNAFNGCKALEEATFDCETVSAIFQYKASLKKIHLSEKVKTIGSYAFSNCTGLVSIELPSSVTLLETAAFLGCSSLTNINLPNSITNIGQSAFSQCTSLGSIVIPNNVKSLGSYAFSDCSALLSIIIQNNLTTIENYTFSGCSSLSSVTIGNGVTSISYNAFYNSPIKKTIWLTNTPPSGYSSAAGAINYVSNDQFTSLSNVVNYPFLSSIFEVDGIRYVPVSLSDRTCDAIDCVYDESSSITKLTPTVTYKGVTLKVQKVQPYICYNNKYINHLTMELDGVISQNAFNGCTKMQTAILGKANNEIDTEKYTGIYIGNNITEIGDFAIYNCSSLNNLKIGDRESELKLGSNSNNPIFNSCPLESVYIGGNITYNKTSGYGYSPFYRNTAIKSVTITDKETEISENEFYGCTNLQRVSIGDGVTDIGDWAFSGCQSLSYFAFGSKLVNIGKEAFSDCTKVSEIISKSRNAPVCGSQALDDINKWECKLYVPNGTISSYQNADQWKEFLFAEEGTGTAEQNPSGEGPLKCGTPNILYSGDKIKFTCDTEGVKFIYRISGSDVKAGNGSEVGLQKKYTISVYATKEGYVDSDVAKSTIEIGSSGVFGDLTGDGVVNVADHVKLSDIIMNQ